MFDTHCHVFLDAFDEDRQEVFKRAVKAGVTDIAMPAIDFNSLERMEQMACEGLSFHKMMGLHPADLDGSQMDDLDQRLTEYCSRRDMVAVGETGLDYHWSVKYKDEQISSLHTHCEVAKALQKPLVLHNRKATEDLLEIIETHQDGNLTGVWHCFNGSVDEGKRALDLGLMLGIGGVTTFKNADVDKVVARLPLDRMILETDAPYLAPHPKRGKRNEPSFVKFTAEYLAGIMEMELEEVDRITTYNARYLYNLLD